MSSISPPQTLRKPIRELLRRRGEPMMQEMRLQDREPVRMSLMKAAHEQYDELPEVVEQWYDPVSNCVVIPLPDPDEVAVRDEQTTLKGIHKPRRDG